MVSLREHFAPIALEDLVQAAASGTIPAGAVAVTFDDGYIDALTTASPILSELGIPGTFFVNSDCLDEPHERWWDIVERVFLGEAPLPPVLALRVGAADWQAATSSAMERAAALDGLNRAAWPLDGPARRQLAADVLSWSGATAAVRPTHRVVTSDDIRVLAARPGHTIGAHTTNHLALTAHPAATKRREIGDDKAALERVLGRGVRLFAYPYGEFDAETIGAVRDAGFHAAVTVDAGLVHAGTNRLLLPRIEITPFDADRDRFERRLQEMLA
jgi:peptidoglycan/xylan/chitin deacetylase (PgdA/CDA1 family)